MRLYADRINATPVQVSSLRRAEPAVTQSVRPLGKTFSHVDTSSSVATISANAISILARCSTSCLKRRPTLVADTNAPGLLAGVHVLVVDDDADTRDILQQVLRYAGALVTTASSSRDALASIAVADVIVTDMSMPGEDGLWLLAQVEQTPRRVPVIVVSGYGDYYDFSGAKFARVLRKPVDPWRLCEAIRTVVDGGLR